MYKSEYLNHQIPFTNKKNQLGIVLHQLDILIIHVWLCKKAICISNNTLLKPDEVILDIFQKIKGLGILCGEIE